MNKINSLGGPNETDGSDKRTPPAAYGTPDKTGKPGKPPLWTPAFILVCVSSFFLFMAFYMLLTTLPLYVGHELNGDQRQIGLAMSVFILAAVVCRPLAGWQADRIRGPRMAAAGKPRLHWRDLFEASALPVAVVGLVVAFAYSGMATFISVYAGEIGLERYASWFFVCFALLIILPRPWTGRLYDRIGANKLVYPGIALFAIGVAMLSGAAGGSAALFLAAGAVVGLGYGLLFPSLQTLAVQSAPAERGGIATSTYFVLFDAGYGIGSYTLGFIASGTGYSFMYLSAAVVVGLTALLYYGLLHHKAAGKTGHRMTAAETAAGKVTSAEG